MLVEDRAHIINLLLQSIRKITAVTEFYQLTLLLIEQPKGEVRNLFGKQLAFDDFNELTAIVEQLLNGPILDFGVTRGLCG